MVNSKALNTDMYNPGIVPALVYREDKHIRMWIDESAPFVFLHLKKFPESLDELKVINEKKVEVIRFQLRKFNAAYSIFDASHIEEFDSLMLLNYFTFCLADQFIAGLAYKAFIKPTNSHASTYLSEVMTSVPFKSVGLFNSVDQALDFLSGMWNERQAQLQNYEQFAAPVYRINR